MTKAVLGDSGAEVQVQPAPKWLSPQTELMRAEHEQQVLKEQQEKLTQASREVIKSKKEDKKKHHYHHHHNNNNINNPNPNPLTP